MITDAPTGTVHPPVKLVMANAVASPIVIVVPVCVIESPDPDAAANVNAGPVSPLIEVRPRL